MFIFNNLTAANEHYEACQWTEHNSYLDDPQWVGIIILYSVLGRIHITIDTVEAGW